ncbi:Hypothetical protein PHPALM_14609 [Phytophthora palmivora]|uniref:Reverse transcriptase n=1 Tax=Phytophthora palmivora TaxID=4796 RepID=A0A2P4XU97_9STRA|nr:Hypothetical protein PHPALM_14609 [Phytophthora palmivora]
MSSTWVDEPLVVSGDDEAVATSASFLFKLVSSSRGICERESATEQLRTIVHAYDVWRLELRADPPANVPPLEVRLRDGARPTKCKPRKYPPHIRKFLHEFNARLVELGLVYENPQSRWSSRVLPVKKSADLLALRQTVDYRVANAQTDILAAGRTLGSPIGTTVLGRSPRSLTSQ